MTQKSFYEEFVSGFILHNKLQKLDLRHFHQSILFSSNSHIIQTDLRNQWSRIFCKDMLINYSDCVVYTVKFQLVTSYLGQISPKCFLFDKLFQLLTSQPEEIVLEIQFSTLVFDTATDIEAHLFGQMNISILQIKKHRDPRDFIRLYCDILSEYLGSKINSFEKAVS